MAAALGEVGAGSSVGYCACLRRELSGEPDAGNLHLRFDEGRVGRAIVVALSPTLPINRIGDTTKLTLDTECLLMEAATGGSGTNALAATGC
jgi:hypothetical protein